MIRLIVFDLDGTLVDSSRDITNAINYAISETDIPPFDVPTVVNFVGEGLSRLIEKILPPSLAHRKTEILDRFLEHYERHLVDHTAPYPCVIETLHALRSYKKAVVSNKREALSRTILDKLSIINNFDDIIGSDTLRDKKPSPAAILHLLNRFSLDARNAVMIGDSDLDIQTGKNAGIRTIGVTYGYRPEDRLRQADFLINDFCQIPAVLAKLDA